MGLNTCLFTSKYTMLAHFFGQTQTRNEAGQVTRVWDRDNPFIVPNATRGILGGGIRVVGSTQTWDEDYEAVEWAKMKVSTTVIRQNGGTGNISRRFRVSHIRDERTNNILWVAEDGDPVEFNIMGVTPVIDPFGQLTEYELLLKGVTGD